jgi:hypothetical protein
MLRDGQMSTVSTDPTTTDAERREWEVPMLSEAQRTAVDLNSRQ